MPEIAVGRLPVTSADELDRVIDSIERFEASSHEPDDGLRLFLSDDGDGGAFSAAVDVLAEPVPPELRERIDLSVEDVAAARERVLAAWAPPLRWFTYVGHAGLDTMTQERVLTSADVPTLSARGAAPVVAAWSCNLLRFDIPGFFALGEKLLAEGAAVAVLSSTGWSNHFETDRMRIEFQDGGRGRGGDPRRSRARGPRRIGRCGPHHSRRALDFGRSGASPSTQSIGFRTASSGGAGGSGDPFAHHLAAASGSGCEVHGSQASKTIVGWLAGLALFLFARRRRDVH